MMYNGASPAESNARSTNSATTHSSTFRLGSSDTTPESSTAGQDGRHHDCAQAPCRAAWCRAREEGGTQVVLGPSARGRPDCTAVTHARPRGRALSLMRTIRCSPYGLRCGVEHDARLLGIATAAWADFVRRLQAATGADNAFATAPDPL